MGIAEVSVHVHVGMKTTGAQRPSRALVPLTRDQRGTQCFQAVERLIYREALSTSAY